MIHKPRYDLSTAENLLMLLRPSGEYTPLEAKILDLALVLHAEHGGGNNSTFLPMWFRPPVPIYTPPWRLPLEA